MGLDITAYRQLSRTNDPGLDEDGCSADGTFHVSSTIYNFSQEFGQGQATGLEPGTYYNHADSMGFRAGSYGGYNKWRDQLAKLVGYTGAQEAWDKPPPEASPRPFYELINFADNEGVIGPVVAAKLAKDFADFRAAAEKHTELPWFFDLYCKWQEAFEMAADGGVIDFH